MMTAALKPLIKSHSQTVSEPGIAREPPESFHSTGTVTTMRGLECSVFSWNPGAARVPSQGKELGPLPYHMEFMTCQDSDHKNLFDLVQKMLDDVPNKHCSRSAALPFFSSLKGTTRAQTPAAKQAEAQGPKKL